jgi:hypothetical protein
LLTDFFTVALSDAADLEAAALTVAFLTAAVFVFIWPAPTTAFLAVGFFYTVFFSLRAKSDFKILLVALFVLVAASFLAAILHLVYLD